MKNVSVKVRNMSGDILSYENKSFHVPTYLEEKLDYYTFTEHETMIIYPYGPLHKTTEKTGMGILAIFLYLCMDKMEILELDPVTERTYSEEFKKYDEFSYSEEELQKIKEFVKNHLQLKNSY